MPIHYFLVEAYKFGLLFSCYNSNLYKGSWVKSEVVESFAESFHVYFRLGKVRERVFRRVRKLASQG